MYLRKTVIIFFCFHTREQQNASERTTYASYGKRKYHHRTKQILLSKIGCVGHDDRQHTTECRYGERIREHGEHQKGYKGIEQRTSGYPQATCREYNSCCKWNQSCHPLFNGHSQRFVERPVGYPHAWNEQGIRMTGEICGHPLTKSLQITACAGSYPQIVCPCPQRDQDHEHAAVSRSAFQEIQYHKNHNGKDTYLAPVISYPRAVHDSQAYCKAQQCRTAPSRREHYGHEYGSNAKNTTGVLLIYGNHHSKHHGNECPIGSGVEEISGHGIQIVSRTAYSEQLSQSHSHLPHPQNRTTIRPMLFSDAFYGKDAQQYVQCCPSACTQKRMTAWCV